MKSLRRTPLLLPLLLAVLAVTAPADAAPWSLDTVPLDGIAFGTAGETVGWGYQISNPAANPWLAITGLSANAEEALGVLDTGIFDFPILAPGETRIVGYLPGIVGLLEWTWLVPSPPGTKVIGTATVTGEFWSDDPLGTGQYVEDAGSTVEVFTATVPAPSEPAPEPAACVLVLAGVALTARRARSA